jgi:hypothetical protein
MRRKYLPTRGLTTVGNLQDSINYALKRFPNAWDCVDVDILVKVKWVANFPMLAWGNEFIETYGAELDAVATGPLYGELETLQVEMFKVMRRGDIRQETTKTATKAFEFSGVVGDTTILQG